MTFIRIRYSFICHSLRLAPSCCGNTRTLHFAAAINSTSLYCRRLPIYIIVEYYLTLLIVCVEFESAPAAIRFRFTRFRGLWANCLCVECQMACGPWQSNRLWKHINILHFACLLPPQSLALWQKYSIFVGRFFGTEIRWIFHGGINKSIERK